MKESNQKTILFDISGIEELGIKDTFLKEVDYIVDETISNEYQMGEITIPVFPLNKLLNEKNPRIVVASYYGRQTSFIRLEKHGFKRYKDFWWAPEFWGG